MTRDRLIELGATLTLLTGTEEGDICGICLETFRDIVTGQVYGVHLLLLVLPALTSLVARQSPRKTRFHFK